jgi:hypothetical protein
VTLCSPRDVDQCRRVVAVSSTGGEVILVNRFAFARSSLDLVHGCQQAKPHPGSRDIAHFKEGLGLPRCEFCRRFSTAVCEAQRCAIHHGVIKCFPAHREFMAAR